MVSDYETRRVNKEFVREINNIVDSFKKNNGGMELSFVKATKLAAEILRRQKVEPIIKKKKGQPIKVEFNFKI